MFARRHLPSIPSLLALEAVARLGSASAAAQELNLTQGAVSRQLQVLEGQLGVPLLIRDQLRLRLTPAATDFVAQARHALTTLSAASLSLRANPNGGALNLAILPAFGMHWLAPRLAHFASRHPEVTLNLSTRLKPFDFALTAFDAAIHYGREDTPDLNYLKLMDEDLLAVAAPALLPQPLAKASDILALPLLQLDSRPGDWARWLAHHSPCLPPLDHRPQAMQFDHFATMIQATIHGLGAALLPTYLLDREINEGRLIPAYGPKIPANGAYYLTFPATKPPRPPLQSFCTWLKSEIS
jgi:LysR family glycine cleavage system transcriptional activator